MITEKEFKERFGFEPQQDDLHRANCDRYGDVGHLMCGLCSNCLQPRFICGGRCWGLRGLGLERVGNELFALPDKDGKFPVIKVFKPADILRLGIDADPSSVYIVRERALSDTAYKLIVDGTDVSDMKYALLDDHAANIIRGRINDCVMAAIHSGNLFKDPGGTWRHACEYWFGERQSRDLDRENY